MANEAKTAAKGPRYEASRSHRRLYQRHRPNSDIRGRAHSITASAGE
jgi:hypothetical protein